MKFLKTVLKGIGWGIAILCVLAAVVGAIFAFRGYWIYRDALEQTPIEETIATIRSKDEFVTYDELPEIYVDAVVSVEDKRFWSHGGVDFWAVGRAVWTDLKTMSFAEGGSTITQQLAKNLYFTQEKKLERKFAELFMAFRFESCCTKKEIFELYVNTIYFGSGYYGIYEATEGYYGKSPSQLTSYESVMLAGLPNAPSDYSPDVNPELSRQRMNQVLNRMIKCGVITEKEAADILAE